MSTKQIRIDEDALGRFQAAMGGDLPDATAANAAVRMAADVAADEVHAQAYGMQRVADWVADGHADPAALAAGDVEVLVTDNLEIHARIGEARFVIGHNRVNDRRRVERAAGLIK